MFFVGYDVATQRPFHQIDVFASDEFTGNPVAVVHDAEGITTEQMLQFTDWTNLSEATFVLQPTDAAADYRVRIFCPGRELPFAGHPTLGTCQAWLAAGGMPKGEHIVQQCDAGLIPIRRDGDRLAFAAPPMTRTGAGEEGFVAKRIEQLGLEPDDVVDAAWIDTGPHTSQDATDGCAIEVRAFFSDAGGSVREDPVTGSLNASVAQWLLATDRITAPYVAAQGSQLGRRGRVFVDEADGDVWVGGRSIVSITGTVDI